MIDAGGNIADELRRVAYQTPFKPFRVKLKSGEQLDVARSMRTTVTSDRAVFGIDEDRDTGVARRMRMVALRDIAAVEVTSAA